MPPKIMMCYKDKVWCNHSDCSNWDGCDKALTEEVKNAAYEWWGSDNYPLAMYTHPPHCYEKGEDCDNGTH